jgi:hypothetical protein
LRKFSDLSDEERKRLIDLRRKELEDEIQSHQKLISMLQQEEAQSKHRLEKLERLSNAVAQHRVSDPPKAGPEQDDVAPPLQDTAIEEPVARFVEAIEGAAEERSNSAKRALESGVRRRIARREV